MRASQGGVTGRRQPCRPVPTPCHNRADTRYQRGDKDGDDKRGDPVHDDVTRAFLNGFSIVSVTDAIAERAVKLRRERRIKLPDAIILATSLEQGLMLVTRNSKDFGAKLPGVRNPYRL